MAGDQVGLLGTVCARPVFGLPPVGGLTPTVGEPRRLESAITGTSGTATDGSGPIWTMLQARQLLQHGN